MYFFNQQILIKHLLCTVWGYKDTVHKTDKNPCFHGEFGRDGGMTHFYYVRGESTSSLWAQRLGRKPTGPKAVDGAVFQARSNTGLGLGPGGGTIGEGTGWGSFRKGCHRHSDRSVEGEGGYLKRYLGFCIDQCFPNKDPASHPVSCIARSISTPSLCISLQVRDGTEILCPDKDPSDTIPTSGTWLQSRGF